VASDLVADRPVFWHLSYVLVSFTWRHLVALLGACPAGWYLYEDIGMCFFMSSIRLNQLAARLECQKMGGDLASITDEAETDFVASIS